MNLFLAAYLVGAFVYGTHVYWTVQISKARRACGIFHDHDHMIDAIEKRGLMSFVYFFGVFLFPLSLAYDCVLNGQQVEKLRETAKTVGKLEAEIKETKSKLDASPLICVEPRHFVRWLGARWERLPDEPELTDHEIDALVAAYDEEDRKRRGYP